MAELLTPVLRTERPGPDADLNDFRYFLSFMRLRTYVGVLGIALPLVVPLVDKIAFSGNPAPRGSISAYYYSGARELFVAILAATGIFMISYKVAERNLDNFLSVASGIAAIFIALFPTGRPASKPPLTPLQNLIGENWTKYIHYTATLSFVVALTGLSVCFGIREGRRKQRDVAEGRDAKFSPEFWRTAHFVCAGFMAAAILWIIITALAHGPKYSILIGEWTAAWAFGFSWLTKGLEMRQLRRPPGRISRSDPG